MMLPESPDLSAPLSEWVDAWAAWHAHFLAMTRGDFLGKEWSRKMVKATLLPVDIHPRLAEIQRLAEDVDLVRCPPAQDLQDGGVAPPVALGVTGNGKTPPMEETSSPVDSAGLEEPDWLSEDPEEKVPPEVPRIPEAVDRKAQQEPSGNGEIELFW
ncbi:hypothetical protein [Acidithiobacillus sp. IBUN Pt1247-S3]|uniref:hypothetical protein n=1 Tax=Acidithiobacillus sp. IBUN Pt1247-S3 TaxID=3166642 RepID=UPI0034E595DE